MCVYRWCSSGLPGQSDIGSSMFETSISCLVFTVEFNRLGTIDSNQDKEIRIDGHTKKNETNKSNGKRLDMQQERRKTKKS